MIMIVFCYGYTSFAPFSVSDFFIFYTLLLVGEFKVYSPSSSSSSIPPSSPHANTHPPLSANANIHPTAPVTFFSWKLIKRTTLLKPTQVDLVWERPTIDNYELTFMDPPNSFWGEMLGPLKFGKMKKSSDRQMSVSGA